METSLCFFEWKNMVETTMEELANKIRIDIDNICGRYHYYKDENVLTKSQELNKEIQQLCSYFLQGNIFEVEEQEYQELQQYVVQVLEDYIEAVKQQDMVLMLDTLDYGLREILNIFENAADD